MTGSGIFSTKLCFVASLFLIHKTLNSRGEKEKAKEISS